jgi:membrane protease YdiL (CAAX protease family)
VALGVVVSALVFGAVHATAAPWRDVVFLQTLMCFTGAGLALIYERRANLVANVAAHMAFNIVGVIAIFHWF